MTALQTRQASIATLNSQTFFRLFQPLESGGDIFEIDTSVRAISVGPQSDIASYDVFYYDSQASCRIDTVRVATGNPFLGRLDALNATQFPQTSLPGRLLVAARDFVNNEYIPSLAVAEFDPERDQIVARPAPRIDLVCHFTEQGATSPLRDDRLFLFPYVLLPPFPVVEDQANFYIIPYYGRRYAHVVLVNTNFGGAISQSIVELNVFGVNLRFGQPADSGGGRVMAQEKDLGMIRAGNQGGAPISDDLIIDQSSGMFDLLVIRTREVFGVSGGIPDIARNINFSVNTSDRSR